MKLKSLLFGSAALLAAGTGAQAADLPIAEPVDYVRICDAFGTGFYYIPGTDTCLRVGGYVRVEAHYVDFPDDNDSHREINNYTTRARGALILDARTQTDLGLVRAYIQYWMHVGPSDEGTNYDGTSATLNQGFIQVSNGAGTFTAGHAASFFDFFGSYGWETRVGIDDNTTEATLFGYTFGGGNGFSATVALEDAASAGRRLDFGRTRTIVTDDNGTIDPGDDDVELVEVGSYEGQEWPDLVGNIRIDQGWGSAQIMGVLHHIHDKEGFEADEGEDDDDMLGWAIGAGATFNLPVGGLEASVQASYADGALGYITNDFGEVGDFGEDDDGDGETNTAWMIRGGLSASFTPTVSANVNGSFTDVEDESGDGDYDVWAASAQVAWEPVSGLYMGPEIAYQSIDYDDDGDDADEDDDIWGVMFRIQRSF